MNRRIMAIKRGCLVPLLGLAFASHANAKTYFVTSLDDAGDGSLREAIMESNESPTDDKIQFRVRGTIRLQSGLPGITDRVAIDGIRDEVLANKPVVEIDANGHGGIVFESGSNGSALRSLAIVNASGNGVTVHSSQVEISGNYIGLRLDGKTAAGNSGDGIHVSASSQMNRIGHANPLTDIRYYDVNSVSDAGVVAWQGIRGADGNNNYLICGTYGENAADGLLYIGKIDGRGVFKTINFPGAATTSIYGPDNLKGGKVRLVGSYKNPNASSAAVKVNGFIYEGSTSGEGKFRTIDYPGGEFTYVHSTMGGLAVGNSDGPGKRGAPLGPGQAFLYDVEKGTFIGNIVYPGSHSNTAYGIWHNGGASYTICGGYSLDPVNNLKDPNRTPIGTAFLVDYNSVTKRFTNWASFNYKNERGTIDFITHFEGISSVEKGVYTLNADAVKKSKNPGPAQGAFVTVRRAPGGGFGRAKWIDLDFPKTSGVSSSNSVFGNQVVGLVIQKNGNIPFQATINTGFQLSNVIGGNGGNGIHLDGSNFNRIAMNYIGTDLSGNRDVGNRKNGLLLTNGATANLIGGEASGGNNPTAGVFVRPPQGNLISANGRNGVLIENRSTKNSLSGNFIGTAASGNKPLGNALDGIAIVDSDKNSLVGTTFQQSPFVCYNVVSGNKGNGLRVENSDDIAVRAEFFGIGANNSTIVANHGNGLLVEGDSKNTRFGGVIPLGNVAAGNRRNGIEVRDKASGFVSFNTFGGLYAFGEAAPNERDGILITSTGGNNLLRTNVISGNHGNGIHIGGNATGVTVDPNIVGLNTDGMKAMPNGKNGLLIDGNAHHNTIGGDRQSIIPQNTFSANQLNGIAIDGGAHHNEIFNTYIGTNVTAKTAFGNGRAGVFLGEDTHHNSVGGVRSKPNIIDNNKTGVLLLGQFTLVRRNWIGGNERYGIYATGNLKGSDILGNVIEDSGKIGIYLDSARNLEIGQPGLLQGNLIASNVPSASGLYATGICTGTKVQANAIVENAGSGVILAAAKGIKVGGSTRVLGDIIADNGAFGVLATGACTGSVVARNEISGNNVDVSVGGATGLTFIP